MSRPGRISWRAHVSPLRLEEIALAIAAGTAPREIFLRFNLDRVTRFQTFRRWVTRYRAELRAREASPPASRDDGDAEPTYRGRWGNRGIRRIRRGGLALISREDGEIVAGLTLVDCVEELRLIADRFIDVAHALFRTRAVSAGRTEGAGAPGAG